MAADTSVRNASANMPTAALPSTYPDSLSSMSASRRPEAFGAYVRRVVPVLGQQPGDRLHERRWPADVRAGPRSSRQSGDGQVVRPDTADRSCSALWGRIAVEQRDVQPV